MELAWSKNRENYAGGDMAAGRAANAEETKGDDPD
jgi:hypothetical protein